MGFKEIFCSCLFIITFQQVFPKSKLNEKVYLKSPTSYIVPKNFTRLILDSNDKQALKNFRYYNDQSFKYPMSGSAQYSQAQFKELIEKLIKLNKGRSKKIFFIDLRQESHVMINGKPITWYVPQNIRNVGRSLKWIESFERSQVPLMKNAFVSLEVPQKKNRNMGVYVKTKNLKVLAKEVETERVMISRLNKSLKKKHKDIEIHYFRFPVADHGVPFQAILDKENPNENSLDLFLNFVRHYVLSEEHVPWLHFHCRAGKGRTTSFLYFYDLILNANKDLNVDDVIQYHNREGGLNLNALSGFENDFLFKLGGQVNRKYLAHKFFQFTKSLAFKKSESWTTWFKKNRDDTIKIKFQKRK